MRITELENSNTVLTEELGETKKQFLAKERQCEEQLTKIAQLEGQLRVETRIRSEQRQEFMRALTIVQGAVREESDCRELEIAWPSMFGFIVQAVKNERLVNELADRHNAAVLAYQAEKKRVAEMAGKISSLNDTVDSVSFELNQVRKDRDELKARSQRQAERITQLERAGEDVLKMQDIIFEARDVLSRYKP